MLGLNSLTNTYLQFSIVTYLYHKNSKLYTRINTEIPYRYTYFIIF